MFKIFSSKQFYSYLIVIFLIFLSIYFSIDYTLYNTDFIHWSFITEQIAVFLNGGQLYKDIFLQYGDGIVILLFIINFFYKVDMYTLGVISSVVFSLKFFFFFYICTKLNKSIFLSLIGTILLFLSISYSQIPWPDIYSGLFLLIFYILLISNFKKENNLLILITSFTFFLTVYFRNTYILNFILTVICYSIYDICFTRKKILYFYKIFLLTFVFIIFYFFILYLNDNLFLWYSQSFGLSDQYFGVSELGLLERIEQYIYYILRLTYHFLIPKTLSNILFSVCGILTVVYIFVFTFFKKFLINSRENDETNSLVFFIGISSLCGLVQLLSHYEIIRYINSSIGVYIVAVYFVEKIKITNLKIKVFSIIFLSAIYSFEIINYLIHVRNYPLSSHNHRTFPYKSGDINEYSKTKLNYFGNKKLRPDYLKYYSDIEEIICKKKYIYNLSYDKTFNFICIEKKNTFKYNIFTGEPDLIDLLNKGSNIENRVIISSYKLDNFQLIKEKSLPKDFRYTKSDTYMKFYPDKLFIYE